MPPKLKKRYKRDPLNAGVHLKTLQDQIAMGMTLMVLEEASDGDQTALCSHDKCCSFEKESFCMSIDFNHCASDL